MSQTANRKFLLVCLASSDGTVSFLIRRKHSDNPVSRTHENAFSDHISLFANDSTAHAPHTREAPKLLSRTLPHNPFFRTRENTFFLHINLEPPLAATHPCARDARETVKVPRPSPNSLRSTIINRRQQHQSGDRRESGHSLGPILRTSKNQILNTDQPWKLALGWRRRNVFGSGLNSPVRAGDSRARVTLMVRNGRRKTAIERAVEYATGAKRTYVAPESPVI
ncbi:hypothetical protein D9611_009089 [Ephemerocybe angulata]|uniref:Uncharacterized protein n=1 Tax=Ephemerocybe angulata TaxID=980116 RepID=A0A8H5CDG7_9AGAR|nr:hypothetical protein D9611_009089 [Tulosesus angulatus]